MPSGDGAGEDQGREDRERLEEVLRRLLKTRSGSGEVRCGSLAIAGFPGELSALGQSGAGGDDDVDEAEQAGQGEKANFNRHMGDPRKAELRGP